uniref:Uncharacterized protein n=1 Tax=Arion vulgaris TaxID=1028688 RepID=A0A0B7BFP0_9EUPU
MQDIFKQSINQTLALIYRGRQPSFQRHNMQMINQTLVLVNRGRQPSLQMAKRSNDQPIRH